LDIFAEADPARMWPDGLFVFGGHEQDGEDLIQAANAAGVDLDDVDGVAGDELLEENAVLAHFPGGDLYRGNGFADLAVALDVVGAGRLFDEERIKALELVDPS